MKTLTVLAFVFILPTSTFGQTADSPEEPEKDEIPYKERLGVRMGYVGTSSGLKDTFGAGLQLSAHYVHRLTTWFSFDTELGVFYMGNTGGPYIAPDGAVFDEATVRVIAFTVSPQLDIGLGEKNTFYVSAGGGLYIVSLLLDDALFQFEQTDDHFGMTAGVGLARRLTTNWFFDVNVKIDKFWTSGLPEDLTERIPLFYILSNRDQDPIFFQVNVGLMLRLF